MSNGLKIFLAVSVLLNILLIGILIGTFSHTFMARREMRTSAAFYLKDLPPEKRELVLSTMKELRSQTAGLKKEIRSKRNEIIDVFTAPVFDPNKVDRKVAEMHAIMGELAHKLADATKQIAEGLTPEERKELGEAIRRSPGPPFPHPVMEHGFHEHGPGVPPPPPDWDDSHEQH
jgi:uncharacterized membrane protein